MPTLLRSQRTAHKRDLYEQVTGVKVILPSLGFALVVRCVACCSPPGLYSHSDEPIVIEARCLLGFERRVDAAISQTVLE
jgi:predicted Zn-ribbon and HTH transcriptional regulator